MADYQVFISFKNSEPDVVMAEALYRELKQRGINTFFSKYSIDEAARADYVDVIDEALDSAVLLVAVGASKKNLTSKWVKAEINQFRTIMNSEEGGRRSLASFRAEFYPECELPSGLKSYQSFSDLNALVRFIEVFFNKDSAFQKKEETTPLLDSTPKVPGSAGWGDVADHFSEKKDSPDEKGIRIGDLLKDKYRILSQVGKGGTSVVYLAIDEKAKKQFAVKEFRGRNIRESNVILESFRGEVEMMRYLKHPAIPQIYDVIDTQGSMILVMDFINGVSFQQILTNSGPVNEEMVLNYARQLCDVLGYLHSQPAPIIYRDMKPANIIALPEGNIKLIDFGTARYYSKEPKNQDTTCLGTIGYAAPEQFGGMGQSDARTDIYNLGATLYHLATGKNPAEPPYEILPVRQVNPNLSRGLEAIILKCTQRDPKQRFQTVTELVCALDNMRRFTWEEGIRSLITRRFEKGSRIKTKKTVMQKVPIPAQPQFQVPKRTESLHETTVLQPPGDEYMAAPMKFAPPGSQMQTGVPRPPVAPGLQKPQFVLPQTNVPLHDTIKKLEALDPDGQRLVRELIDRLSK